LSVPLVIAGGGRYAADSWLKRWLAQPLGHSARQPEVEGA
ncbi:MAG: hypothetical protein RL033_3024, partial [Pseudomonadota bacterium]